MANTTHFAFDLRFGKRLLFVRDIAFGPLDLGIECEGSSLAWKVRPKEMVGPGKLCMRMVKIGFKPLYFSTGEGFKAYISEVIYIGSMVHI